MELIPLDKLPMRMPCIRKTKEKNLKHASSIEYRFKSRTKHKVTLIAAFPVGFGVTQFFFRVRQLRSSLTPPMLLMWS